MTILALGVGFAPEACTLPKLTAGSGVRGDITPQTDTPPASDTLVVPSSKEKKNKRDEIILVYAIALVIVSVLYFKLSVTNAH